MGGWKASAGSCRIGFSPAPCSGAGSNRKNGEDANNRYASAPLASNPCTPSVRASNWSRPVRIHIAPAAPNPSVTRHHSAIDPSWFPHAPAIL